MRLHRKCNLVWHAKDEASHGNRKACQINGIHVNRSACSPAIRVVVERYFFVSPHDIVLKDQKQTIECSQFVNDEGTVVGKFRDFGKSGYFNLYVNGMMQGASVYRIKSTGVTLAATGQIIYQGTPIIIESIGFYLSKKKY